MHRFRKWMSSVGGGNCNFYSISDIKRVFAKRETRNVDIVLVSACGFDVAAETIALRMLLGLVRKVEPWTKLVIIGCLPGINPAILKGEHYRLLINSFKCPLSWLFCSFERLRHTFRCRWHIEFEAWHCRFPLPTRHQSVSFEYGI